MASEDIDADARPKAPTGAYVPESSADSFKFQVWGTGGGTANYNLGGQTFDRMLWYRGPEPNDIGVWFHRYSEFEGVSGDPKLRVWYLQDPSPATASRNLLIGYRPANSDAKTPYAYATFVSSFALLDGLDGELT